MLGTLVSLTPFVATFSVVSTLFTRHVFPSLSHVYKSSSTSPSSSPISTHPPSQTFSGSQSSSDKLSLPLSLHYNDHGHHLQEHALEFPRLKRLPRQKVVAATFGATIGLSTVLAELILAEILGGPRNGNSWARARALALTFTVPTLLVLLIVVIPFLELQSVISGEALVSPSSPRRRRPRRGAARITWLLHIFAFAIWLFLFWSVGKAMPVGSSNDSFTPSPAARILTAMRARSHGSVFITDPPIHHGGLSRACLDRILVVGISLLALLSGFASVSSPWHTFADGRARRHPITSSDIARKQMGLENTSDLLAGKRQRLRLLREKLAVGMAASSAASASSSSSSSLGVVSQMIGSLKGLGGGGDTDEIEIKTLELEISGLEIIESELATTLSLLRDRQAAQAREGTALGRLMSVSSYIFSIYCLYRILAMTLATVRRLSSVGLGPGPGPSSSPEATFSSSDPINRVLALVATHWDPSIDQDSWARQISFLLSGVMLAASASSVVQTAHLFAKWAPGLVAQAQANLALLIGQIAATYVISAAFLLRKTLPRQVGQSVDDVLGSSALDAAFVDRWFEGWFLLASGLTAGGLWAGRKVFGREGAAAWEDWDDFVWEEMGQKRS